MTVTLSIRDETLSGETIREWELPVTAATITIRDLIRERVYQEVKDLNRQNHDVFRGLVRPEDAEEALNGWKVKKRRRIDWKPQFERAVEAFQKNQILILIDDRQAESPDEEFVISSATRVSFLRLTMLVGG